MWESPELWLGIVAVVTLLVTFGWRWLKSAWPLLTKYPELLALAEEAAKATADEYTSAIKKASEDGKLTKEEQKAAMGLATAKFMSIAKSRGLDAAKGLALPLVRGLIEKGLTRLKG